MAQSQARTPRPKPEHKSPPRETQPANKHKPAEDTTSNSRSSRSDETRVSQTRISIPESKVLFLTAPYSTTCHAFSNIIAGLCKVSEEKEEAVCDQERGEAVVEKLRNAGLLSETGDILVPLKKINEYISENKLLGDNEYILIVFEQEPAVFDALVVNNTALDTIREAFKVVDYNTRILLPDGRIISVKTTNELTSRILLEMERAGIRTSELENLLAGAGSIEDALNILNNAGYSVQEVDPSKLDEEDEIYSYAYKVAITPKTHIYVMIM